MNDELTNKLTRQYKALIFDVDGTIIPNRKDGMPSKRVTEAVAKASKILHVGAASSRPLFLLQHIFAHLKLSGPSIVSGGALVIDITEKKTYYRQTIDKKDISIVQKIARNWNIRLYADTDEREIFLPESIPSVDILGLFIPDLTEKDARLLRKEINSTKTLSAHIGPSWTKGKWTISISHAKATKQHAIFEIAKILGIKTEGIIGIGDGGNDFPLLMACGLKIAMGNAIEDIKEIADYVAPSVDEDGVAHVIDKFVLH